MFSRIRSRLAYAGLITASILLAGLLGLSYWNLLQSLKGFEQVMHQEEFFDRFLHLFADLKEAEDWQREYLLTGDERYLVHYRTTVDRLVERLERMEARQHEEALSPDRVGAIVALTSRRLELLRTAIDRRSRQGLDAALEVVRAGEGARVRNQLRQLMLELESEDMEMLRVQHDRAHEAATLTVMTLSGGMALLLLLMVGLVWTVRRDLDERRRLEQRLIQEAKLAEIARRLGDIGHDVKNMLMPIISGTELLHEALEEHFSGLSQADAARAETTRARSAEVLEMTRNCSRRIQERVREIVEAVKGETTPLTFAPCSLARLADGVLGTLRVYATERGVSLSVEGLDQLPPIRADERRLFNALYNLVNNAIPEVPAGGSVTVRGRDDPATGSVILSVADTGRGMPPEVRDSLFSDAAISRKPGGTGLGTKIVRDVVAAHGGTVTVDSQEGQGTTFTLRLPVSGPSPSAPA